jgi:DHA2 family multidrug resistance protein-like MFS transporter
MLVAETASDGLPTPRRYYATVSIWLGMGITALDTSIANVALPAIAHDLHTTPPASIWVVTAYQIAVTMLLLPIASLGEVLGLRRVYTAGLLIFVVASLACAIAGDLTTLSLARFAQGVGGAGVMAINGAMVRLTYPNAWLGRGIGYNTMVVAIASAAGPSVAAAILAVTDWRWLFAINVPIGMLSFAMGLRNLPESRARAGRFDMVSALLSLATFGTLFLMATDLSTGPASVRSGATAIVAIASGYALIRRAHTQSSPLFPLDLIRIPILRLSYATSLCSFAAQTAALIALPFFLQGRFGFDLIVIGLLITIWPLTMAIASPLAGRMVESVSAATLGGSGMVLTALGLCGIGFSSLAPLYGVPVLIAALAISGAGFGLFQAPNNRILLGMAPLHRSGAAAGMLATARLVGQTAGAVLAAGLFRIVGPNSPDIFLLSAGLAAAGAFFSLSRLARRTKAAADI